MCILLQYRQLLFHISLEEQTNQNGDILVELPTLKQFEWFIENTLPEV